MIHWNRNFYKVMVVLLLTTFLSGNCVAGSKNKSAQVRHSAMSCPAFFDEIEHIVLYDELAQFLGASKKGIIEITYPDIVKTSGHSCAVVSSAYLAAVKGLKALYPNTAPQRGKILVEIKKKPDQENAGVVGTVLSNITGATTDYGFGGIPGGKFNRRNLLFYQASIDTDIRFTRLDTKKQVGINIHIQKVVNPMSILMSAIGPNATAENKQTFPSRFQNMVQTLFEHQDLVIEVIQYPVEKNGTFND